MLKGTIVKGIATRFSDQILFVNLEGGRLGHISANELSMYDYIPEKEAAHIIGKTLFYEVLSFYNGIYYLSRKSLAQKTLAKLKEDFSEPIKAIITNITSDKVFVDYKGVAGLCLMQNMTYARIHDTSFLDLKTGDPLYFIVTSIGDNNKLFLSHKECFGSFEEVSCSYNPGDVVSAKIVRPVNKALDVGETSSYFCMIETVATGIIDIPKSVMVAQGQRISVIIKKSSVSGIRGNLGSL